MFTDSSIIIRIQRFLKTLPPFHFFNDDDLIRLSNVISIAVCKNQTVVFEQGKPPQSHFYIVKKGAVEILNQEGGSLVLVDKCGEGDLFGIRPILANSPYAYEAKCTEDAILYEVPITLFKEIYYGYPEAVDYMIGRFAAGRSIRDDDYQNNSEKTTGIQKTVVIRHQIQKDLVSIQKTASIGNAIEAMNEQKVSSIVIVNDSGFPLGIITDTDIRSIVGRKFDLEDSVMQFMSSPVKCIAQNMDLQEIQLTMIGTGFHHLCITEDGTDQSKGLGMVTEHDILYANATDPVVILKKIKSARSIEQLKLARKKIDQLLPSFLQNDNQQ